jgi:hypothetical protein
MITLSYAPECATTPVAGWAFSVGGLEDLSLPHPALPQREKSPTECHEREASRSWHFLGLMRAA